MSRSEIALIAGSFTTIQFSARPSSCGGYVTQGSSRIVLVVCNERKTILTLVQSLLLVLNTKMTKKIYYRLMLHNLPRFIYKLSCGTAIQTLSVDTLILYLVI